MFRFNKLIILTIGVSLVFLQACEKFNETAKLSETQPIIISDPGLGAKLAMDGVAGVVDVKLTKDEDSLRVIPYGSAAFLKKPVSGIDARVIAQDLPFAFQAANSGKNKVKAEASKKLTDKERKTTAKLTDVTTGIEYDTEKVTGFDLVFNYGTQSVPDDVLPSSFRFRLDKDGKILKAKGFMEGGYNFDSTLVQNALSQASVASKKDTLKGTAKGMMLSAKSGLNSFGFPTEFFVQSDQANVTPTDLGSKISIDTTQGYKFKWKKNNSGENTFMSIRIFVHNDKYNGYQRKNMEPPFSARMFIDTVDDGEYELKPAELEKLKIDKGATKKARVFIYRTAVHEFALGQGSDASTKATDTEAASEKVKEDPEEEALLASLSDEERLAYEELKADEEALGEEKAKEGETEEPEGDPAASDTASGIKNVMLCSVGTTGMVDITTPKEEE